MSGRLDDLQTDQRAAGLVEKVGAVLEDRPDFESQSAFLPDEGELAAEESRRANTTVLVTWAKRMLVEARALVLMIGSLRELLARKDEEIERLEVLLQQNNIDPATGEDLRGEKAGGPVGKVPHEVPEFPSELLVEAAMETVARLCRDSRLDIDDVEVKWDEYLRVFFSAGRVPVVVTMLPGGDGGRITVNDEDYLFHGRVPGRRLMGRVTDYLRAAHRLQGYRHHGPAQG